MSDQEREALETAVRSAPMPDLDPQEYEALERAELLGNGGAIWRAARNYYRAALAARDEQPTITDEMVERAVAVHTTRTGGHFEAVRDQTEEKLTADVRVILTAALSAAREEPQAVCECDHDESYMSRTGVECCTLCDRPVAAREEPQTEKEPSELRPHIVQAQEEVRAKGLCGAIYDDPEKGEVVCIRGPHTSRHGFVAAREDTKRPDEVTDTDRLASALDAIRMLREESDPVIIAAQKLVQNALGDDALWAAVRPLKLALDGCPTERWQPSPYRGKPSRSTRDER